MYSSRKICLAVVAVLLAAGSLAGKMRQAGRMWVLLPRGYTPPQATPPQATPPRP